MHRETVTKIVEGRALRKNNWRVTPSAYSGLPHIAIERERPGPGHRHLVSKSDIVRFVRLLPEWAELSEGLNAIVLARADDDIDGWSIPGAVRICAWNRTLWRWCHSADFDEHRGVFQRLGVKAEAVRDGGDGYVLNWTPSQARAYQLLHVLLHEFGHHHDRMTNRSKRNLARGERYAEQYALLHEARIWIVRARVRARVKTSLATPEQHGDS